MCTKERTYYNVNILKSSVMLQYIKAAYLISYIYLVVYHF